MKQICADLAAEHVALDAIVAGLTDEQWRQDTPAEGWDIADTIAHLVFADLAASMAVADPAAFEHAKAELAAGRGGFDDAFGKAPSAKGAATLAWWRENRAMMLDAFAACAPKDRIPWFGPSMSALSFATARLMETWAHGQDVAATLGQRIEPSDRLRHVCHIGVTTRGWSYVNRGLAVPEGDVRIELTAPSGELWTWGPQGAENTVVGSAFDFAVVATQRRALSETSLVCQGEVALDWMRKAQAFAGPPTDTDPSRHDRV